MHTQAPAHTNICTVHLYTHEYHFNTYNGQTSVLIGQPFDLIFHDTMCQVNQLLIFHHIVKTRDLGTQQVSPFVLCITDFDSFTLILWFMFFFKF